jgi:hypothetical protein
VHHIETGIHEDAQHRAVLSQGLRVQMVDAAVTSHRCQLLQQQVLGADRTDPYHGTVGCKSIPPEACGRRRLYGHLLSLSSGSGMSCYLRSTLIRACAAGPEASVERTFGPD